MNTRLNKLLALVMALMMIIQLPTQALAEITYTGPGFSLEEVISQEDVSYRIRVEHYTTAGEPITLAGAPAAWYVKGTGVRRLIDETVLISDPAYVFQRAELRSDKSGKLTFPASGIAIGDTGLFCYLSPNGKPVPVVLSDAFSLRLYYDVTEAVTPAGALAIQEGRLAASGVAPAGSALVLAAGEASAEAAAAADHSFTASLPLEGLAHGTAVTLTLKGEADTVLARAYLSLIPGQAGYTPVLVNEAPGEQALMPLVWVTANEYEDTLSANLTEAFRKLAAASDLGEVRITLNGDTMEPYFLLEVPASSGVTGLTLSAPTAVTVMAADGAPAILVTNQIATTTEQVAFDMVLDINEAEPTTAEIYAQMQSMGDEELAELLNSLTPAALRQLIIESDSAAEVEKWTLLLTEEAMDAYNAAYPDARVGIRSPLRARSLMAASPLALDDETTSGVNQTKSAVYRGPDEDGNELFDLTLEAWTNPDSQTITTPLDIVLVVDVSGSMAYTTSGSSYQYAGAIGNVSLNNNYSSYYVKVDENYYQIKRGGNKGNRYYYWEANGIEYRVTQHPEVPAYRSVANTRLSDLKAAATNFVSNVNTKAQQMNTTARFSVIQFAGGGSQYNQAANLCHLTSSTSAVAAAINGLTASGATYMHEGLNLVPNEFAANSTEGQKRIVVIFSDGDIGTSGRDQAYVNQAITSGTNIRALTPSPTMYAITIAGTATAEADLASIVGSSSRVYSSTSGMSIDEMFNQVLQEISNNMEVKVVDYLDQRFTLTEAQKAAIEETGATVTYDNDKKTWKIVWDTTLTSYQSGTAAGGQEDSFKQTITVTRKSEYIGDNTQFTNDPDSGIYAPDGSTPIETFEQPVVNVQIREYGRNAEEYRLLGTATGIDAATAQGLLYSEPEYDPTLGMPAITYTWKNGKTPAADTVLRATGDTSYILNVTVTPTAGTHASPGNYNEGPIQVSVAGTNPADPDLTLTYHVYAPTFTGANLEIFLGEKLGDIYPQAENISSLVNVSFDIPEEAQAIITDDVIKEYKTHIKYYVKNTNTQLENYAPTDSGSIEVEAYYGDKADGVKLGEVSVPVNVHKGVINVQKVTDDGASVRVTFSVEHKKGNGVYDASLANPYTVTANDNVGVNVGENKTLPMGTYTITETVPGDYTGVVTTGEVTLGRIDGSFMEEKAVVLQNTRKTGSLTLTKTVDNQVEDSRTYTFTVTGKFADGKNEKGLSVTVTKSGDGTLPAVTSSAITGLLYGEEYILKENDSSYTFKVDGKPATNGSYTFTYQGGETGAVTLAVANEIIRTAVVGVSKHVENATAAAGQSFTFTLKGRTSGVEETVTLPTAESSWYAAVSGFMAGETVTITETGSDLDSFDTFVQAAKASELKNQTNFNFEGGNPATQIVVVAASDEMNVTAENAAMFKNLRKKDAAEVKKSVAAGMERYTKDDETFAITVSGPMLVNGAVQQYASFTLTFTGAEAKAGAVKTQAGYAYLAGEKYTVTETAKKADGTEITSFYTVTGTGDYTHAPGGRVEVENSRTLTSLTVKKALTQGSYAESQKFDVTVSGYGIETMTLTLTANDGVGKTISVPLGESYTVTEIDGNGNTAADYTVAYNNNGLITGTDPSANVITVTNTRKIRTLTIDKAALGTEDDKAKTFAFTATGADGLNESFTLADASPVKEIEAPVGTTVTVTETLNAKYTTAATANGTAAELNNGALTYKILDQATNEIVYTNTRNAFETSRIKKVVSAADYAAMTGGEKLTIIVAGQMKVGDAYQADTVTTPEFGKADMTAQEDGTYAYIYELPSDKLLLKDEAYTVTEAGASNFDNTVVQATGAGLTQAVITVTNALKPGLIQLGKTVSGYAGNDATFTVEITGLMKAAEGTVAEKTITAEIAKDQVTLINGGRVDGAAYALIAGVTYTVVETGAENYSREESCTVVAKTAPGETADEIIVNTRRAASLSITKAVEDAGTVAPGDEFTFTVTRETGLIAGGANTLIVTGIDPGKVVISGDNKAITLTLKPGETATITGLFLNEPITVAEEASDHYTLTDITGSPATTVDKEQRKASGNLPAQGALTFTNTRRTAGALKVKKLMDAGALAQLPDGRAFTIRVSGGAYNTDVPGWTVSETGDPYYELTFDAADIQAGTEKTVPGALYGITYTVAEIGEGTSYTPSYNVTSHPVNGETFTFQVTNTPVAGELKIMKRIEGYDGDLTGDMATVVVKANGFEESHTFTKSEVGQSYAWSVPGVVEGQTYTITETAWHNDLAYKTQSHTAIAAGPRGSNTLATVTNERRTYKLTFNKITDYDGTFYFTVAGVFSDSDGKEVTRNLSVTTAQGEGSASIENLLAGYAYTITETESDYTTPVANYIFTVDGESSGNPFTYTNSDTDKDGQVAVFVDNTRMKADLKVTKTIADGATLVGNEEFTIEVTGEFADETTGEIKATKLTFTFTAAELAAGSAAKAIAQAKDVPAGTNLKALKGGSYTANETAGADSFDVTYPTQTLTLKGDGTDELKITNARKEPGSLQVTKAVKGFMGADETFTVRVTGAKFANGTAGATANDDGTFYVEHIFNKTEVDSGTAWQVPGALYGVTYTVTEPGVDTATYKTEVITPASVTMDGTAKTVTVTNEKQSGDLTVTKTMKDGKPIRTGDSFSFTLTGSFNKDTDGVITTEDATLTVGVADAAEDLGVAMTLPQGYTAIVGQSYTLTETITGSGDLSKVYATTFNGGSYVAPAAGEGSDTRSYTFTYGAGQGQINSVAVVNERLTAPLTLSKTLSDTTASAVESRLFTFTIAPTNATLAPGDVTWDAAALQAGESVTFADNKVTVKLLAANGQTRSFPVNLPVSVAYTITETDGAGYTTTVSSTAAAAVTDNDARTAVLTLADAAAVSYTNTRGTGSLTVTKTVVGYNTADAFTFTLKQGDTAVTSASAKVSINNGEAQGLTNGTFQMKHGDTAVITGLAADTAYTVDETPNALYTTVKQQTNTSVAFTNTRITGKLTVNKSMVGPVKAGDSFQLMVPGYKTITDSGKIFLVPTDDESQYATYDVALDSTGKAVVEIDGLMKGRTYTLVEKLASGEIGANYSAKWNNAANGFTFENVAGGSDQTLTLINTRDTKPVTVTKEIGGTVMPLPGETFVAQVTGLEGFADENGNQLTDAVGKVITTATATFSYDAGTWEDNSFTLKAQVDGRQVDAYAYEGGSYTFVESTANGKAIAAGDCAWTAAYSHNGAMQETETGFTGAVTNTRKDAGLTVTKSFAGIMAMGEVFEITVSGIFSDGATGKTQKFFDPELVAQTIAGTQLTKENGVYTGSWTVPNVIFGNVYTVTERILVNDVADTIRYETPAITSNNPQYDAGSLVSGTVVGDPNAAVTVTNARKYASLTVTKAVVNGTPQGGETFQFSVSSDDYDYSASFMLGNGGSKVLTGLPVGVAFTVTEEENTNYDSTYQVNQGTATSGSAAGITLSGTQANTIDFTNTRKTGPLTLTKKADQIVGESRAFKFTLTGNLAAGTPAYDVQNPIEVIYPTPGEAVISGLLEGESYTLTEIEADDYAPQVITFTYGTAAAGRMTAITVNNMVNTGKLTVNKSFVGPVKAGDTFRITINAKEVGGKLVITTDPAEMIHRDITVENPRAEFTGLMDGQTYTLAETLVNDAGERLTQNYESSWTNGTTQVTGTGADQAVTLTNTRRSAAASLVKTMLNASDAALAEAARDTFKITVTGRFMYQDAQGAWLYTDSDKAITATILGTKLDTATGLAENDAAYFLVYGESYTVSEEALHGGVTSTAYTPSYKPGASFTFNGALQQAKEGVAAYIHVDNALDMNTLTVTKTVVDASHEANALDNAFTFTYARSDALNGEEFTLGAGDTKTFTLPANVTATITETADSGYKTEVRVNDGENAQGNTAEKVASGTVAFTNIRLLKTEPVDTNVTKVIDGPEDPAAFTFQVNRIPAEGEKAPVSGVTLEIAGGAAGSRTFTTGNDGRFSLYQNETAKATNLAANYSYAFVEIDKPDTYGEATAETGENGTTVTNHRIRKGLEVTKALGDLTRALEGDTFTLKVTGRFTNKPNEDQTLTFTFTKDDGTLAQVEGEAAKSIMDAEEFKDWTGAEVFAYAGLTYTLAEETPANFKTPGITPITEGEKGYTGKVTNTRARSATEENPVQLRKIVNNVKLMDETDVFTITVNGLGIEMIRAIAKDDLTDGAFTWELGENETLLAGETYTVAESIARGGEALDENAYGKAFAANAESALAGGRLTYRLPARPEEGLPTVLTVTNTPAEPEPEVEKTADEQRVHTGDTVTFTLNYQNTSFTAASVTDVTDTYDQRLTFVPGSVKLNGAQADDPTVDAVNRTLTFADLIVPAAADDKTPGKLTLTYEMTVTLLKDDAGHAEILNKIEGSCGDKEVGGEIIITGEDPVITLEKAAGVTEILAGEAFDYTLTVRNSGLAEGLVEITDTLDPLTTFVSFSPLNPVTGAYDAANAAVKWTFNIPAAQKTESGEIIPSEIKLTFTVSTGFTQDGATVKNVARITSDDPYGPEASNETTVIIKNPPMSIRKSADRKEAHPGETLTYTLTVVSNSLAAHEVLVEDALPKGMTFKGFETLGLGGLQDAADPQRLTWRFEMPAATRSGQDILPAIVEIKFSVTLDALAEDNEATLLNTATVDETPDNPTDDPIPSDPEEVKVTSEVRVEKYSSTNFAYVGTQFMYVFRFYNTNTAPVTGRFIDYFNQYLGVVDFEKAPGTAGYEHVLGQQIYEDNSIGIDFVLPPATVNADGTVTASWVDVGVYVQALAFPTDNTVNMTVPNTGMYRDNLSGDVKETNTVYVLIEQTYVLPQTGEGTMRLVPIGAVILLMGVALILNERRRRRLEGAGK